MENISTMKLSFLTIVLIIVIQTDAARILAYFPMPSISHQIVFRPITQELAKRGHEVVVITTDPAFPKGETPENLTEIDVHEMSYKVWHELKKGVSSGNRFQFLSKVQAAFDLVLAVIEAQLQNEEVHKIINGTETYDLLLLEALIRPALAFSHKFKVPVIQISSFGANFNNYEVIGAPSHPLLYPTTVVQRVYNLTLWEKIKELLKYALVMNLYNYYEEIENRMMKKYFGEDLPRMNELLNNVDMLFLNVHPIFEGNNPVPPGVVHMWGIHVKPEKELPTELQTYLDSSKRGVIYMSFGTNCDPANLPSETLQKFIRVFAQLPYDVLWRWTKDVLPGKPDNVRVEKWFPQSDLLRHPNVKLFIIQGGLQSTDEAIIAKVPMIGLPILGDQWRNVEKYTHFGIGAHLYFHNLTDEVLKSTIEKVIENKSYRENIDRLSTLMQDQPMATKERIMWWIEHVLRHGGARHYRAPAANMGWTEYYNLDVVLTLLSVSLIVLALSLYVMIIYFRFVFKLYKRRESKAKIN